MYETDLLLALTLVLAAAFASMIPAGQYEDANSEIDSHAMHGTRYEFGSNDLDAPTGAIGSAKCRQPERPRP